MTKEKSQSLFFHGSLLAITSIVVRFIGFFYRIPLVRLLGDEGIGYYSSAFEIYAFLLIISSYGLPVAISKLIAEKRALKQYSKAREIFSGALILSFSVGLILSLVLFVLAKPLAGLVGNEGSYIALKSLAPALLIFSVLAVFRGYFQGHNTMVPTSISQVIEQIFNAAFSLILAYSFVKKGLRYGAAGGTLGTGIGALSALIFLVFLYIVFKGKKKKLKKLKLDMNKLKDTWKIILLTAFPIILGSSIYNLSNLTDMIFFQRGLLFHSVDPAEVSAMYGILASKFRLLITVPIAIASAFGAASIPSITTSKVVASSEEVLKKVNTSINAVLLIAFPSIVGLMVLAKPIAFMLFGKSSLDITGQLLITGSASVLFFSLSSITTAALQGIGKLMRPVRNSAIAIAIKIVFFIILNFVFNMGLYGAIIVNYIFSIIVFVLNYLSLRKELGIKIDYMQVLKPLGASLAMGVVAAGVYYLVGSIINKNLISVVIAVILAALSYLFITVRFHVVEDSVINRFNFLKKLAKKG